MRKLIAALAAIVALLALAGCTGNTSTNNDREVADRQLTRYQEVQPVPQYDWSQYRATVIDIQNAQVHGQATTSFFFNQGVQNPIFVCPSIGFPVPSTAQLTNPEQKLPNVESVVAQSEPNGVYTGESTATYVVCIDPDGVKYVKYWEGFVDSIGGPASWDADLGQIVLDGAPTVEATTQD